MHFFLVDTSRNVINSKLLVHRSSKTVNRWMPPAAKNGNPMRKNMTESPMTIQVFHLFQAGTSSKMKEMKVWTPPQMEDMARLMSMKKKRKDQRGGTSISITAEG